MDSELPAQEYRQAGRQVTLQPVADVEEVDTYLMTAQQKEEGGLSTSRGVHVC